MNEPTPGQRGAARQTSRAAVNNRKAALRHYQAIGYTPPPPMHVEPKRTPTGLIRSSGKMKHRPQGVQPKNLPLPPRSSSTRWRRG